MRKAILAIVAHLIVGVCLYFALTLPLLSFTINGDSITALIKEELDVSEFALNTAIGILNIDLDSIDRTRSFSVITGAERLYENDNVIAALAIVIFSVAFPILKLASGFLHAVFRVKSKTQRYLIEFHRLSMLDVFVAAVVVFVISRSSGYIVSLEIGFYAFLLYWGAQYLTNLVVSGREGEPSNA